MGAPVLSQPGNTAGAKTIKLGYCQGESYYEFDYALNYLILAFEEKGMIGKLSKPLPYDTLSRETWEFLKNEDQSSWQVQFAGGAYFSLDESEYTGFGEEKIAQKMLTAAQNEDVDVFIACGTMASLAAKQLSERCAVVSLAASDPVKSRIVARDDISETENVWAMTDPGAFNRSIMTMYDILQPKTVGVIYAGNDDAYIYSGADELDKFTVENGIEVKKRFVDDPEGASEEETRKYYGEMTAAFEELSNEVDVFVMTTSLIETADMKDMFEPFYERNIPIYSINSTDDVKYGALMAIETSDYESIGYFTADTLAKYADGAKLSELPQIFQTAPFLTLNITAARRIGYKPDFKILLVASKIYAG
jgi:ABC-type uncharacterized transport system substrate-binding protein